VALRAEDEERRTVHNQGMASVFSHKLRERVVIGLRLHGGHAQTRQENGECGQSKGTEEGIFVFRVHVRIVNGGWKASSVERKSLPVKTAPTGERVKD
jgi:hypothetical protein